jgi:hypothetical protein
MVAPYNMQANLLKEKLKGSADFSRQCDTLNIDGQWATLTVD